MTLRDVRSNRFIADIDVNPKNVEDSFRTHDRNVQDLDARVDIVNETLVKLGQAIDSIEVVSATSTATTSLLSSLSRVLKSHNLKIKRFNERY